MKKIILFNLVFIQTKKWVRYHGGGENDYTVLIALLDKIGNQDGYLIYGHYEENKPFIYDLLPLTQSNKNFFLVNKKELEVIKRQTIFDSVYTSDIHGFDWIFGQNLKFKQAVVVIHGIRRYELQVKFLDLLLPNRLRDKFFVLQSLITDKYIKQSIENQYRQIFSKLDDRVSLIATSNDTYYKLLALCPKLEQTSLTVLYTSPKKNLNSLLDRKAEDTILEKYNLESKKYFLLISLGRIEKNVYFALKNLKRLYKEFDISYKTFVCGESKNNFIINSFKKQPEFLIQGYVDADELSVLYKHAFLFIYPTLSEGFGMPVLEAMQFGTPVCCSALSPLIEIGGTAAEYFSLNNDIEFRSKILKFYNDKKYYHRKSHWCLQRFEQMTEIQKQDLNKKVEFIAC